MAEDQKNVTPEEKKVVFSYTVTRFNDQSVDVLDNSESFEGVDEISSQDIYDDIEAVAKLVEHKKNYNMAYSAAHQYYQDLFKAQQEAQAKQDEKPAGEVLPPE